MHIIDETESNKEYSHYSGREFLDQEVAKPDMKESPRIEDLWAKMSTVD